MRLAATFVALALASIAPSCLTVPADEADTSIRYLGDRSRLVWSETIVAVAQPGTAELRNLHVALGAAINPREISVRDPSVVAGLVARLELRVNASVAAVVLERGPAALTDIAALARDVVAAAQATVDAEYARWADADAFEVEVLLQSIYVTDGSVVREESGWW